MWLDTYEINVTKTLMKWMSSRKLKISASMFKKGQFNLKEKEKSNLQYHKTYKLRSNNYTTEDAQPVWRLHTALRYPQNTEWRHSQEGAHIPISDPRSESAIRSQQRGTWIHAALERERQWRCRGRALYHLWGVVRPPKPKQQHSDQQPLSRESPW